MVIITTGISEESRSDAVGQTYQPAKAIARGSDFLIVGRGIYKHLDGPVAAAKRYQALGWEAYRVRVGTR
jgi:orotidine-5'-phosphate decarboxylase